MSTPSDIAAMREEVLRFNSEINTMTHLLVNGNIGLRDFLVMTRALFGGNKDMAMMFRDIQLFIALMGTARAAAKAFQLELGPIGWAGLALGTAASIIGYQVYESTTGV